MWRYLIAAASLAAIGLAAAGPASARVEQSQSGAAPNCRPFTAPVIIDGETRQATGLACQQPDGSWRITQEMPELPRQIYGVPPVAYAYPYPYPYPYRAYGPWWYGPSFIFVGGFRHGHFHHHR
jgi:hypothetical protein